MKSTTQIPWRNFLKSGNRIFIGSNAAVPNALIRDLIDNSAGLHDLEVCHILTLSDNVWAEERHEDLFHMNAFFLGAGTREAVARGAGDYTPCFLSEVPGLFQDGIVPLDAALIMVSPPDEFGYCSMGVSVDVVSSAAHSARYVMAQVNRHMPRTSGHSFLHVSQIDAILEADEPLPEIEPAELNVVTERIGQYVALLINDGDTLQMGIGDIPNAVLRYLANHKDLGVHTEMVSDGVLDLIRSGVINNRRKTYHRGKTVTSFCMGSKALYDFVHNNPHVEFYPSEHVNSPVRIARNDNMVSINGAIEVDLTGQVVSDSIGYRFYSGIGGQVDFIRGAAMSRGGRPIIALPSTARNGTVSKIVPTLTPGGGVVTSRGDVHYVVTEYGVATMRGKSVRERALELIKVAHPKFRDELLAEVRKHYYVPDYNRAKPTPVPELGAVELVPLTIQGKKYFVRPLAPADERPLQEFFYSHSKETLIKRYNHQPSQMTREKSASLVSVDQGVDLALCIVDKVGPKEVIRAVGRYYYHADENAAEVAFVVQEQVQNQGIGSYLLRTMLEIARKRGLSRIDASVRADNHPMLHVFDKFGFERTTGRRSGESANDVELTLALDRDAAESERE
jgi:acyl-CoA hydrolase/RimJ/RimL family protein N-acetyltransferase